MDSRLKLILKGDPEEVLMLLIRLKSPEISIPDCEVITQFGDIITCRVKRKYLIEIYSSAGTLSVKAPRLVTASFYKESNNTIATHTGDSDNPSRKLQSTYTGEDVYFATVDWGFDIAHNNLRKADGTTRFKCFWNQNGIYDGNRYGYGCFYSAAEINSALSTDTPYQTLGYHPGKEDVLGAGMHGTHVIDIAAGTPAVGEGGVANKCRIVGVQLGNNFVNGSDLALGDSVKLIEALHYIYSVTQDAPCVINMSLGSHGDSHTGKSLAEIAFDNFLNQNPGYAIVQSVGNYYTANCHIQHTLKEGEKYNIEWNIPRRNFAPAEVEIWYPGSDEFSLTLISPDGEVVADVPAFKDIQISYREETFGYIFHRANEPNTGLNHIDIILDVSILKGKWIIGLTGAKIKDGAFHAYCERNDASQSKFSPHQTSPYTTTGSVCNSKNAITVGACNHKEAARPVVLFSSSGPTVFGQSKPDLLAPGYKIKAARSAAAGDFRATNQLTQKSGSSMASPHVAGAVALLFQKYLPERLPIEKVKQLLSSSLDPLPATFSKQDTERSGNGYLNIIKLLKPIKTVNMNTRYITRPVPRRQEHDYMHAEEYNESQEYHSPYLHQGCSGCRDALINEIDIGSWAAEPDLLTTLSKNYFNNDAANSFDVYRHFHPLYQYNYSPYETSFSPVALPGSFHRDRLQAGDIILSRLALSGKTVKAIVIKPAFLNKEALNGSSSAFDKQGLYVQAYGNKASNGNEKMYVRVADMNNITPANVIVVRGNNHTFESPDESYLTEDTPYKEFNLKYVKYGKGGGYMYAGDHSINYDDVFRNSNLTHLEIKMARHFLQTEGGIDSINTYDNQVITWGFGFAGRSGNFTIALYNLISTNAAAAGDFNSFGITLTSPAKASLTITDDQTYNGDGAISFWKLSKKYLNILITLTQKYAQDAFLAQWRTFKKIHRVVFTAFEDNSYLANMPTELEKDKSKTAILHAHHHYPGFNPPGSFKDASSFEEVLQIYVNQSSKFGSVQDHANAWRRSINRIFDGSTPVAPPTPVPPVPSLVVPVHPVPDNSVRPTVRFGARGNDVIYLQQRLNYHLAGTIAPLQEDGNWGSKTQVAVLAFQRAKALVTDGVVGPNTWAALNANNSDSNILSVPGLQNFFSPLNAALGTRPATGAAEELTESSVEEIEWGTNPGINSRYATAQDYKVIKDAVISWGVGSPAAYIEAAIREWNASPGIHRNFGSAHGNNFDGNPHNSYLNLKRLYEARGIANPAGYFSANIIPITFFNKNTVGHRDLQAALANAQATLTAAGNTFMLGSGTWSFVPRTFNNNINKLSNHALGKAIDINPSVNPHVQSRGAIHVINAVCNTVLPNGLLAETNPDTLLNASVFFQQTFNDAWVGQQTQSVLLTAIRNNRQLLNVYATHGFLNLPATLIRGLQSAGLNWGGAWRSAKDFMHFELPNP